MASKHSCEQIKKRLSDLQSFSIDNILSRCEMESKHSSQHHKSDSDTNKSISKKPIIKKDIVRPCGTDHLFWCFYVMHFGEESYFMHSQGWFAEMGQKKIEMVTELRKNKALLKPYKLKLVDMEGDLVSTQITNKAFVGLCVLKSVPVIFVKNRTFMRLGGDSSKTWNIVTRDRNGWYLRQNISQSEVDGLTSALYEVCDMDKPIKSISGYTISQLQEIAVKLGIDLDGRKLKKSDLYQEILSKL